MIKLQVSLAFAWLYNTGKQLFFALTNLVKKNAQALRTSQVKTTFFTALNIANGFLTCVMAAVLNPVKTTKRVVLPTNTNLTAGVLESLYKRLTHCLSNRLVNFFAQYSYLTYQRALFFIPAADQTNQLLSQIILAVVYGVCNKLLSACLWVFQLALLTKDPYSANPTKTLGQYINNVILAVVNLWRFSVTRYKLALLSYEDGSVDCYL